MLSLIYRENENLVRRRGAKLKKMRKQIAEFKRTFNTGENFYSQHLLGARPSKNDETEGYTFRVWAPHAQQVWLAGDFNDWDKSLPLTFDSNSGIWEIFTDIPKEEQLYKYIIQRADGSEVFKFDPYAIQFEERPGNAAVLHTIPEKKWQDGLWLGRRKRSNHFKRPLNIYEVHASSWRRHPDGRLFTFSDLTNELIPYVKEMGFTHIEFMPLMEHPLGASWGYQLTGYFALSSYYGTPEEFQTFVETCHINNIGVFVDWVPGHFSRNDDALAYYDGTPQFEYSDIDRAENRGWGSLNFDLGKPEVQSFLISNILYWIEMFHIDGIRVDAVSNMIYRDYDMGPWSPNHEGGNRNFEGFYFLQKLNSVVKLAHPDVIMVAEESSSDTKITGMVESGSLGFDYKWNLGWMNDVLKFFEMDPIYRKDNLNLLTFSFMYMMDENFILPFSHDEVVHGKKSLMHKMWGDRYRQFAQLRTMFTYWATHPGKQLLFMGSEWGQFLEWKYDQSLEWVDLKDDLNKKMQNFTQHLNRMYSEEKSLWIHDDSWETIEIIDANNTSETVLSFMRKGKTKSDFLIIVMNLTPVERQDFHIGVPYPGVYQEVFNTEMVQWGGTWTAHNTDKKSQDLQFNQLPHLIQTTVPALGTLIIKPKSVNVRSKK